MKYGILFLLSCFTQLVIAQNWAPVNTTDIYNYKADTASAISHSLWIDSVGFDGTDSIYYPNRIVKHISNSLALKNQPQFLNKQVTVQGNGLYLYTEPTTISYYSLANVSDTYTYDTTNNITATVMDADTALVFGIQDSVKTIVLSSADTIIASKNHGFVQYPIEYGSGKYYRLAGIEGGRTLGEHVAKFDDFFNYAVGDTFWYYIRIVTSNPYWGTHLKFSVSIDSIYQVGDTTFYSSKTNYSGVSDSVIGNYYLLDNIGYDVNLWPNTITKDLSNPSTYTSEAYYNIPVYVNEVYDNRAGRFECYPASSENMLGSTSYVNSEGRTIKSINSIYCAYTTTDSMAYRSIYDLEGTFGGIKVFQERLGITKKAIEGYNGHSFSVMCAYRLSGDSALTILDPQYNSFIIGINETEKQVNFKILGNPVSNILNLQLESEDAHTLSLYNLSGQQIIQKQTETQTVSIDVTSLPQGIYLLEVRNKDGVSRQRVVKM